MEPHTRAVRVSTTIDPELPVRPTTASLSFSLLALGLAACAGTAARTAAPADAATADTTVVADDVRFVDPPSHLPVGTSVLALHNRGEASHDVTVEGAEDAVVGASPGELTAGEVTLEPGRYTVFCSVGGHRDAGMEFTVTVG